MKFSTIIKSAVAVLFVSGVPAFAATATYEGNNSYNSGNCIPFTCPDSYGPHMGFVYQNLDAFTLSLGDIIAFDLASVNDHALSFNLSLGATTTNGGSTVDGNGFTSVAALGLGVLGDTIIGNYDVAFVVTSAFTFAGGGLIVDFENTNGAVVDTTHNGGGLVSSTNPYTVSRYFSGSSVGDMTGGSDSYSIGNMRIISDVTPVPLPAGLPLLAAALGGLGMLRRRKKS